MAVHYIEEDRKATGFKRAVTKKWLHDVVTIEGKKAGVINFIFCSDEFLADINFEFLKRDYYTDVITFDYTKNGNISGDIMISVDRVNENALNFDVTVTEELKRMMVHGLLHLIGYDDVTEELKAVMSAREDFYLAMGKEDAK